MSRSHRELSREEIEQVYLYHCKELRESLRDGIHADVIRKRALARSRRTIAAADGPPR